MTSPTIDIRLVVPLDSRRISSRRIIGGASDSAPVPATTTGVFDVGKYLSVVLKIYADQATGAGNTVDISIWRYVRLMEREPTTGTLDTAGWSEGETFDAVALGYDEGNKEFLISTNNCEKMFVQVQNVPAGLTWMWVDVFVDVSRYEAVPVLGAALAY